MQGDYTGKGEDAELMGGRFVHTIKTRDRIFLPSVSIGGHLVWMQVRRGRSLQWWACCCAAPAANCPGPAATGLEILQLQVAAPLCEWQQ